MCEKVGIILMCTSPFSLRFSGGHDDEGVPTSDI
jgi:hypothetical protein